MGINLATIPKIALLAVLSLAILAAVVSAPSGTASADAMSGEAPPARQADTPETPEPAATPMPTPEPTTRLTNERDAEGNSILYDPVWRGNKGAVEALIRAGADVNAAIRTAIPSCIPPYGGAITRWYRYWWTPEQTPTPWTRMMFQF